MIYGLNRLTFIIIYSTKENDLFRPQLMCKQILLFDDNTGGQFKLSNKINRVTYLRLV